MSVRRNCHRFFVVDEFIAPKGYHDRNMNQTFRWGSSASLYLVIMMKHIMTTGVASVALATAALLAPAALAEPDNFSSFRQSEARSSSTSPYVPGAGSRYSDHNRRDGSHSQHEKNNGLSRWEYRQAVQACAAALDQKTDRFFPGRFGDAEFVRHPRVDQIRRHGNIIRVSGPVRVSNRGGSGIIPSSCTLRHGRVIDLDFNPQSINRRDDSRQDRHSHHRSERRS